MKEYLTFNEVALVPQYNNIESRTEPSLKTWLTDKIQIDCPILCANMDTAIGPELAEILLDRGSIPIFHRFAPIERQIEWIKQFKGKIFISAGLKDINETFRLLDHNPLGVTLDVAHGHSKIMLDTIYAIKNKFPDTNVIAGNVCSAGAYQDLVHAGANAVKAGVGPGSVCLTRMVTGFGTPQFSTIYEMSKVAKKLRIPIISDGGIENSRDVVLALAAGASTVMCGKLFARTRESAGEKAWRGKDGCMYEVRPNERLYPTDEVVKYRGQASLDFQEEFYGELKDKTVPEGVASWMPVSGSAHALLDNLLGGLRSGLTYGGARTIKELQRKAEFVKVGAAYMTEARPRTET